MDSIPILDALPITTDYFRPHYMVRKYIGNLGYDFGNYVVYKSGDGTWVYRPEQNIIQSTNEVISVDSGCLSSIYITLYASTDTYTEVENVFTFDWLPSYPAVLGLFSINNLNSVPSKMRLSYSGTCKSLVCYGQTVEVTKYSCGGVDEVLCSTMLQSPVIMTYIQYKGVFMQSTQYGLIELYYRAIKIYYTNTVESGATVNNNYFRFCFSSGDIRFRTFEVFYENSVIPHWYNLVTSTLCSFGRYASTDINEPCKSCPVGKYSNMASFIPSDTSLYQDASFICYPCPDFTTTIGDTEIPQKCVCPGNTTAYDSTMYPYAARFQDYYLQYGYWCIPDLCPVGTYHNMDYKIVNNYAGFSTTIVFDMTNSLFPARSCQPCSFSFYRNSSMSKDHCVKCPDTTGTSFKGATSINDCVCDVGFYFSSAEARCVPCAVGFYKDSVGNAQCTPCPSNSSTTVLGSASINDCVCDLGYSGSRYDECIACARKTYKNVKGNNINCQVCPGDSTTEFAASTDFSACKCGPGYKGADGSNCELCSPGTFKLVYGNYPCISCTDTYVTVDDGTGNQGCFCNYGNYQDVTGMCVNCPINTYKDTISNSLACTPCTNNSITLQEASVSVAYCLCEPRYGLNSDGECVKCPSNTYQSGYSRSACVGCPLYSTSQGFSVKEDCVCNSGYTGPNGGPCIPCNDRTYKPLPGNANCTSCPSNTVSALASVSINSCICKPGYFGPAGLPCQPCDANAYKPETGNYPCRCKPGYTGPDNGVCSACLLGYYKISYGSSSCDACPPGSSTLNQGSTSRDQCLCSPGHFRLNGTCEECPIGTYSTTYEALTCIPCTGNTSTLYTASSSPNQCLCKPGHELISVGDGYIKDCQACGQGFFKSTLNDGPCSICPPNSWTKGVSPPVQCQCVPNYAYDGIDPTDCNTCSEDAYWDGTQCLPCPLYSSGPFGRSTLSECVCLPGYSYPNGIECLPCPYNTYKDSSGNQDCTKCPFNTMSGLGSDSVSKCACPYGYFKNGDDCDPCPAGTYKPDFGNTSCLNCKPNSISQPGSKIEGFCLCKQGYYLDSQKNCVECQGSTYKDTVSNAPCLSCKQNEFFSGNDHTTSSSCVCDIGYYQLFDGSCVECNVGEVKYFLGPGPCINPLKGVGCSSLCSIGQRLQTKEDVYDLYIQQSGICGQSVPTLYKYYNTSTSSYTTVNATLETYLDQWGDAANWKEKTRVIIPTDYTAPECYWYLSNVQPSVFMLSLRLNVDMAEVVFKAGLYRCSSCGYSAGQCSTIQSFDLKDTALQQIKVSIDVYSCVVLRVYSENFPLILYNLNTLGLLHPPQVLLQVTSKPPTCECVNCDASDTAIAIVKPSFIKIWASKAHAYGSIQGLDDMMRNTSLDLKNSAEDCVIKNQLHSRSFDVTLDCTDGPLLSMATMVRFSSFSYVNRKIIFTCKVDILDSSILIKFDGRLVYSIDNAQDADHYVEMEVGFGEHMLECYSSSLSPTTNSPQISYLNWTYHYQPFSMEINNYTEGGYACLRETDQCGDCTLGRRPKYPASSCPCELCPAGTYGTYRVGPDPYACELCEFGKYSSSPGSIECSQCPENSITSSQGAARVQDCECKQGYYFDVSRSLCKECPPATYKNFIGNQACLPCPGTKMSSIPGSTQADQCFCLGGFIKTSSTVCEPCPANTYQHDMYTCKACPLNHNSSIASPSIEGCVCSDGYAGENCTSCDIGYRQLGGACVLDKDFVKDVSASLHTCALFSSKEVKCWGLNDMGQLGYLDVANRGDDINTMGSNLAVLDAISPFVAVVTTRGWSCGQMTSLEIKCWGNTWHDTNNLQFFFDGPSDLNFGDNIFATSLSAGMDHVCGIFNDQRVRCWGDNSHGQLGTGDRTSYYLLPYHITPSHPNISFPSPPRSIACGSYHTCVLLENRKIYCWGNNLHRQLGFISYNNEDILKYTQFAITQVIYPDKLYARGSRTCVIDIEGQPDCWGYCDDGTCGANNTIALQTGRTALKLALTINTTCVLLDNHRVSCFGSNQYGQLGIDSSDQSLKIGLLATDMSDALRYNNIPQTYVDDIFSGYYHFCYTDSLALLRCWGYNEFGQLGYENTVNLGDRSNGVLMSQGLVPINVGSIVISSCESGYFYSLDLLRCVECNACPSGSFATKPCSTYHNTVCQPCATNLTSGLDSNSYTECSCKKGFERVIAGDKDSACKACDLGYFKIVGTEERCQPCPNGLGSTSYGLESLAQCECPPGYYGSNGGECTPCPVDTYKEDFGSLQCQDCPDLSKNAILGSTSILDCKCQEGYYDIGVINNVLINCRLCPNGKYSNTIGSKSCLSCGYGLTSPTGSRLYSDCTCADNFFFYNFTNRCEPCPNNFYRNPGDTECKFRGTSYVECTPNSTLNNPFDQSIYDCVCDSGFYGNYLGCAKCPSYSINIRNQLNNSRFTDCKCIPGYTAFSLEECRPCQSATYKDFIGNEACTRCPDNQASDPGSISLSQCQCIPGYELLTENGVTDCFPCKYNYYKNITSNELCLQCPNNSYTVSTATNSFEFCICTNGYYGTAPCTKCDYGYYSNFNEIDMECKACPLNSYTLNRSSTNVSDCLCLPGFYSSTGIGPCSPCPLKTYQPSYGSTTCIACGQNTVTLSTGSSAVYDCKCIEGYEGDGTLCLPCPYNSYKSIINNSACVTCPINSFTNRSLVNLISSSVVNCICAPGYVADGILAYCDVTAEGYYKPLSGNSIVACPLNTISSTASKSVYDCQCKPGFYGSDGNICLICPENHYKSERGNRPCTPCPENMVSSKGSTSLSQCYCPTGHGITYNPQTMAFDCKPCWPQGFNLFNGTNTPCKYCPPNSVTLPNVASSISNCTCKKGYEGLTVESCSQCYPGKYKETDGFGTCKTCPTGLIAEAYGSEKCKCDSNKFEFQGQCYNLYPEFFDTFPSACAGSLIPYNQSIYGCTCMPGTYDRNGFLDCVSCPAHQTTDLGSSQCYCVENYYMDSNGDCQICPSNKASPAKSTSVLDCSCPQCEEDGQCVPCAYPCPANSYFEVKPYSIDDCLCEKGYYKDGLECKACGINSTTSFTGATDSSSCVCSPGNYRDSGVCKPCPISFYKASEGDGACSPCPSNTYTPVVGQTVCQCSDLKVGPGESFKIVSLQELIIDTTDCYIVIDQHQLIPGEWISETCEFRIQSLVSLGINTLRGSSPFAIYSVGLVNITGNIKHLGSLSESRGAGYYAGFCYYGGSGGGFGGQGGFGSAPGGPTYGAKELWPWSSYQGSPGGQGGDCNVYSTETNLGGQGGGGVLIASYTREVILGSVDVSGKDSEHQGTIRPGGGGSGGAILLISPLMVKAANLLAKGGSGSSATFSGGGGGGGRIAIWSPVIFYESISVLRGEGYNQVPALDGTIYEVLRVPDDYQTPALQCYACKNGSYYQDNQCIYCGDNQITSSVTGQCECKAGYTSLNNHGQCIACPIGSYKSLPGIGNCTQCPYVGSYSPQASTSLSQCLCNSGYYLFQGKCEKCPVGTYSSFPNTNPSCQACPTSLTTMYTGSTSFQECSCPPGTYYDQFNVKCNNCSIGYYYPSYGYQLGCIACPSPTITPYTGSTSKSDCKCSVGYYFNTTLQDCKACEVGKYDPNTLNDFLPCTSCPVATYNPLEGSIGPQSCIPCPRGTYSLVSESSSLQDCQSCPVDTYQSSSGATYCISCPSFTTTFTNRSISVSQCQCLPGYFGNLECQACPPGSYKQEYGDYPCTPCPQDTYSQQVGLSNSSGCQACPLLMYTTSAGSNQLSNCTCNPGSYFVSYSEGCMYCDQGYYQPFKGNFQCISCPQGTYGLKVGALYSYDCLPCPLYSNSSLASSSIEDCKCYNGYYRDYELQQCLQCPAGKYGDGNQSCIECPTNTYQDQLGQTSISSCKPCQDYSQSQKGSTSREQCQCNQGYQYNQSSCQACSPGSYKTTLGNTLCTPCPLQTYSTGYAAVVSSSCIPCIPNSTTLAQGSNNVYQCLCNPGYYRITASECRSCQAGSYKDSLSNSQCQLCPSNTYSTRIAAISLVSCTSCPLYSHSDQGSTICSCDDGYIRGTELFCSPCPAGTYDSLTSESCSECPFATYSPSLAQSSESTCLPCPLHSNTLSTKSTDILDCICDFGYYRQSNLTCRSCQPGQYKPTTSNQFQPCEKCSINTYAPDYARTDPCLKCPGNSTTLDRIERTSLFDCVCNPGFYGNSQELPGICLPCPANHYCPGGQNKIACFANSTSPPLSVNRTQCRCIKGFVFNNVSTCSICPAQYYCPGLGDIVPCPFDSDSPPGSTSEDDCQCRTGFLSGVKFCEPGYTGAGTGLDPCRKCLQGYYKSRFGNFPCVKCPEGKTTLFNASTSLNDCVSL